MLDWDPEVFLQAKRSYFKRKHFSAEITEQLYVFFSLKYCFKTTKKTEVGIKSSQGRIQVFEVTDPITF